jgi:hypothetical protein
MTLSFKEAEMGLTMRERRAVTKEIARRYRASRKKEKGVILDEFTALTGYNRAYAVYLLNLHGKRVRAGGRLFFEVDVRRRVWRRRKSEYESVRGVLVKIWEILGYPCGKRLKPILPEVVTKLEGFKELILGEEDKEKLFRMSAATIDRLLKEEKKKTALKGRSHTKPGTLLKHQIPIRTFSEWDETKPGYLEVDLVAHEGGDPRGDFIQTLCAVDVCTGWVEIRALKNKAQKWVFSAIDRMRQDLPFDLLGLDSDNGAEFINNQLYRYCLERKITFTRSRKYRKNDNCYVEQKNYSVVRKYAGYFRYDREEELKTLSELYEHLRVYINFFQPVMKQISKVRVGSKVIKRYDIPKTPYQRILDCPEISDAIKENLKARYEGYNPAELHREITRLQKKLLKMVISKKEKEKKFSQQTNPERRSPCYNFV